MPKPLPPSAAGASAHVRTTSASLEADAARRRQALRRLLARHNIRPAELARRIGAPNPNAIYNFLHGRSTSISQRYLERILAAFPDAADDDLVLRPRPKPRGAVSETRKEHHRIIAITCMACASELQDNALLPQAEHTQFLLPPDFASGRRTLFGVAVKPPGAELRFPVGSILICEELAPSLSFLEPGQVVLVEEQFDEGVVLTVRSVRLHEGQTWLWSCSDHPDHQAPLPAPWHLPNPPPQHGIRLRLLGRVIASWQPLPLHRT